METATALQKQIRKTRDSQRFNIDHLQEYTLHLLIGLHDFQLCVIDTRKNRVLLLEDYILQGTDTPEGHAHALDQIYEQNHLLHAAFWKEVKVGVKNRQFSLVPQSLFDEKEKEIYLQLNADFDPEQDKCKFYKHTQSKISTAFGIPKYLLKYLKNKYPNGNLRVFHHSNAILEGLMKMDDQSRQKGLHVFIDRFYLHLAVARQGRLEYFNTFHIRSSEDYIKYMLGVMQNLKMDQHAAKVMVWGFIRPQSNHYKFLNKYARNMAFGHRPSHLKMSYEFDELGDHQYFDLFNLFLCD